MRGAHEFFLGAVAPTLIIFFDHKRKTPELSPKMPSLKRTHQEPASSLLNPILYVRMRGTVSPHALRAVHTQQFQTSSSAPDSLLCPLSGHLLVNPAQMLCTDGEHHTFDLRALQAILAYGNDLPTFNAKLKEWCAKVGISTKTVYALEVVRSRAVYTEAMEWLVAERGWHVASPQCLPDYRLDTQVALHLAGENNSASPAGYAEIFPSENIQARIMAAAPYVTHVISNMAEQRPAYVGSTLDMYYVHHTPDAAWETTAGFCYYMRLNVATNASHQRASRQGGMQNETLARVCEIPIGSLIFMTQLFAPVF